MKDGIPNAWLEPGESAVIEMRVEPKMLAYFDWDQDPEDPDERPRPHPDPYPVYILAGMHAGQANECLKAIGRGEIDPEKILQFVLKS